MATLKQRLHRKNSSGGYDTIWLETTSDLVKMSGGSTTLTSKISSMDKAINGKAASSHSHDDRYYTETEVNSLLSAKQNASTAINTSNIGSQSVNYATTAHGLRTYNASGTSHGTSWVMNAQHNKTGDGMFRIYCGDASVGVSVNRADVAGNSDTVDSWHVQLDPGTWGLKPFSAGTGDMVAGSTALATGHIYLVYE